MGDHTINSLSDILNDDELKYQLIHVWCNLDQNITDTGVQKTDHKFV